MSGLELRGLERFDVLVRSGRGSLLAGLGVSGAGVLGADPAPGLFHRRA